MKKKEIDCDIFAQKLEMDEFHRCLVSRNMKWMRDRLRLLDECSRLVEEARKGVVYESRSDEQV